MSRRIEFTNGVGIMLLGDDLTRLYVSDYVTGGTPLIQEAGFVRATTVSYFHRGNLARTASWRTSRNFKDIQALDGFLHTHAEQLSGLDAGGTQLPAKGTLVVTSLSNISVSYRMLNVIVTCSIERVRGRHLWVQYQAVGGRFQN